MAMEPLIVGLTFMYSQEQLASWCAGLGKDAWLLLESEEMTLK